MPSPVVHFEIRSSDPDATRKFFGQLFGWTFPDGGIPGYSYVDTGVEGAVPGGIETVRDHAGLHGGCGGAAARHRHPVLREQLLRLILEQVHVYPSSKRLDYPVAAYPAGPPAARWASPSIGLHPAFCRAPRGQAQFLRRTCCQHHQR